MASPHPFPLAQCAPGLALLLALALASCSPGGEETPSGADQPEVSAAPAPRPDVVLISLDTLRPDHLTCYGYERDTSPVIDALAEDGVLFENAYSTAPWTLVAHMSMLSGLFVDQHNVTRFNEAISESLPLLAERFADAGYETAGFHAGGWIHARHGFERGFDLFLEHENAEQALAHIEEFAAVRDPEQPLFTFIHLFDVHSFELNRKATLIYSPPDEYARRYVPDAPDRFEPGDALELHKRRLELTDERLEGLIGLYDGGIRYTDEMTGRILAALSTAGIGDEDLIVLTSDHGESLGRRKRQIRGHGGMRQEGLRIPLIVRPPAGMVEVPARRSDVASIVDLAPTILEVCGLERSPAQVGMNLLGPPPAQRLLRGVHMNKLAILDGKEKTVVSVEGDTVLPGGWSIDLLNDPGGFSDIGPDGDTERFREIRGRLLRAYVEAKEGEPELSGAEPQQVQEFGAAEAEKLRALGYTLDE